MAVYTQLSDTDIQQLITRLDLGQVICARGVAAGVENSTYFVTVANSRDLSKTASEFVLTIAETLESNELAFVSEITCYLSRQQLPVPAPQIDRLGRTVFDLCGKPAMLMPKVDGAHPERPSPAQCAAIGRALGQLHAATLASGLVHESHRSLEWVWKAGQHVLSHLVDAEQQLLAEELTLLDRLLKTHPTFPQAIIHGDLFRDNALFIKDELRGIIDFFSAGNGFLMLDLAIVANDWCRPDGGHFSEAHLHSVLAGYATIRCPEPAEMELWPQFLRIAALRFWVSRLTEAYIGDGVRPPGSGKDPDIYRDFLIVHRDAPTFWNVC